MSLIKEIQKDLLKPKYFVFLNKKNELDFINIKGICFYSNSKWKCVLYMINFINDYIERGNIGHFSFKENELGFDDAIISWSTDQFNNNNIITLYTNSKNKIFFSLNSEKYSLMFSIFEFI